MYARKIRVEILKPNGAEPCPLEWLDSFFMRSFTGRSAFDETLPVAAGFPTAKDSATSARESRRVIENPAEAASTETAAPISTEFRICHDEHSFGMDFRDAMDNLTRRVPLHDVQIMATAILIQKESGGNLAEIVEKVAHIIRERFRLRQQIKVHTAQGRLTVIYVRGG